MKPVIWGGLAVALVSGDISVQAQTVSATDAEINAFVAADRDQDGHLDLSEFRSFVHAMAALGQPTARTIKSFAAYRYAFALVDKNRDGRASPQELRKADTKFQTQ